MTLSGGHTMAQRYAKDWIRLLGMHNCGRKVKVLGLQWERGDQNPPIPLPSPPKRKAPPWMFVSASEVPAPDGEDERLDALVVRVAAPSADGCYALLREMLAPLEAELGAPPYAERGLS